MKSLAACCAALCIPISATSAAETSVASSGPALAAPAGFSIELVAGPPLVDRPIVAAFDDEGRLYVAESSGSNDPVDRQLDLRPHRILRLEDVDGDGRFDKRTVFAAGMMFPAGTMFVDGSLYVAAPPSIWKLTDADGDGVAERRVEWFKGVTLTGCANDLHGPYLGPDGWVYWCKGAFAEQTHQVRGREWTSRAAHIFRCRLDGSGLEPVITGGMDNPVDVTWMPAGESILSATYLVGAGRRDGLVHAIYGGVYGKDHGVLDGHARTGELMPPLVLMSPAAPCGLDRYDSDSFGADYRDNLFVAQFNLRKVSRHVLSPEGSSFVAADSDFITSDNVDFHPTDVLMDADGSLLVVDTGGWYKLCCPTSQLWKPDVLGGVYRVRRIGAEPPPDPRGRRIAWAGLLAEQLWALLADARPGVRQRAARALAGCDGTEALDRFLAQLAVSGDSSVEAILNSPSAPNAENADDVSTASLSRTWALSHLEAPQARALMRRLLDHPDERVRQAALHAVGLYRDVAAFGQLLKTLAGDVPASRRVAAEALGRIGDNAAVPHLLAAAAKADDRILRHSITYALIELADPQATQDGLASDAPGTVAAALVAIDQMPGGALTATQVIPLLRSHDDALRNDARWVAARHPEWGGDLVQWFRQRLKSMPASLPDDATAVRSADEQALNSLLVSFASHSAIQELLADAAGERAWPASARQLALRVMAEARLAPAPLPWRAALVRAINDAEPSLLPLAVAAARTLPPAARQDAALNRALAAAADHAQLPRELRVAALAAAATGLSKVTESQLSMLLEALSSDNPVAVRTAAAEALAQAPLTPSDLGRLCDALESAGPLELNRLLPPFERTTEERLGLKLLSTLRKASVLPAVRVDVVRRTLAGYGPLVLKAVDELESLVNVDAAAQRQRIDELLPLMAQGDRRRGHAVYYSSQAACSACHRMGYAGGTIGPELTRIGESRTERDLLESILYPSLSFVRSYEPVVVVTNDGRAVNGVVRDETEREYVLATGPDQETHIRREHVDEIQPSTTSIMPAGLDKQLSVEQLADLVSFLKNSTGQ